MHMHTRLLSAACSIYHSQFSAIIHTKACYQALPCSVSGMNVVGADKVAGIADDTCWRCTTHLWSMLNSQLALAGLLLLLLQITPKNILMIGPTGCGKTEIARRLAKLVDAPFVKVWVGDEEHQPVGQQDCLQATQE